MSTCPSRPALWRSPSLILAASLLTWMGCGGSEGGITDPPGGNPPPTTPTVSQVALSADSLFFGGLGLSRSLTAQARAADGTVVSGATISWQSSSTAVATVTASGSVTAVAPGQANITASSGSASAVAKVVVEQVAAGLAVSPATVTLDSLGATAPLQAAVVDSGGVAIPGPVDVEWVSENGSVAVVNGQGVVLARGPGNATVRATSLDAGLTASAAVSVTIPALAGVVDGSGGTVSAGGGAATLTVPRGGVTAAVAITAEQAQPANTDNLVGGTAWTFGPALTFGAPADLEIAYAESAIPSGQSEESLGLYRLEGSSWTEAGSVAVDVDANKVVGTVTATGTYALRAGRLGDPTGLWLVTETTTFDSCYDEAGTVEQVSVYAEKNGDVLTVDRDGETVSGTLVGNVFGWDESYVVEGVNVRETYTITINRTGAAATGSGRFVGSGPVSCEIRTTLEAELVSRDRPAAAANVHTLTLAFVENPGGLSTRTWRPETGEGTRLVAQALDRNGAKVPVDAITLYYSEPRVLTDAPGAIFADTPTNLKPGLVGTTEIRAMVANSDGSAVRSNPVTLTLARDTTLVNIVAPPPGTGRFFDMEPLIVWQDDNGEAVTWEIQANQKRLPLHLRRGASSGFERCGVGERCVDTIEGLWDALGLGGDTPFVRIEGVNALGNVVSSAGFHFTHAVHNRAELRGASGLPLWEAVGNGYSPAGTSVIDRFPNDRALYCTDDQLEGCLHAYVQQGSSVHLVLMVERRGILGARDFARVWIPRGMLDGTLTTARWNCGGINNDLPVEEIAYVNFQWWDGQAFQKGSGSNNAFDPTPGECTGNVSVTVKEYTDIRGTWRTFEVGGNGTMKVNGTVRDVTWGVTGSVKWANGEVERPAYGGWSAPGR